MVGGLAAGGLGDGPVAVAAVMGGESGAVVTPGCGVWDRGAEVTAGVGLTGAVPRPGVGTVEVALPAVGVVLVVVVADEAANSLTTSRWARTDVGRSVTSAATIEVAAQTMAVEATVTANQSAVANNRVNGTS